MQTSNTLDTMSMTDVENILGVDILGPIPSGQPENTVLFMKFENYKTALCNIKKRLGKPVVTPRSLTWNYKSSQLILPNDPSPGFEVMLLIHN